MNIVCLDLEGVLVPEIWISFSQKTGIPEFQRTTRDEPDYDKLMLYRMDLLKKNNLKLADIQDVISGIDPMPGALEFTNKIRNKTQLIILSDTFEEFSKPLMIKLGRPVIFCNKLAADKDGFISSYKLRQKNGKCEAVKALKSINMRVFASGDSYNDLEMIKEADTGCLFRAPDTIRKEYIDLPCVDTYDELLLKIDDFLNFD